VDEKCSGIPRGMSREREFGTHPGHNITNNFVALFRVFPPLERVIS